jgi:hypothetical protein
VQVQTLLKPMAAGGTGGSGIVILKYLVPVGTTVTHIYKGSGSWVAPEGVTAVDYLVVAGGGGGGGLLVVVVVLVVLEQAQDFLLPQELLTQLPLVLVACWRRLRRLWHRNYQIHNLTMDAKIYRLYGIDTAMHLLRPNAKWEISNSVITKWDDPRPQPSMEEVREVMDKIQAFEDSINTVWLPEQIEELTGRK